MNSPVERSSKLLRPHIAGRVLIGYFAIARTYVEQAKIESICSRHGLPLLLVSAPETFVSISFFLNIYKDLKALLGTDAFCSEAGRLGLKPGNVDQVILEQFVGLKHPKSMFLLVPSLTPLFNGLLKCKVVSESRKAIGLRFECDDEKLETFELRAFSDSISAIVATTSGYLESLPTVIGFPKASIRTTSIDQDNRWFAFDIDFSPPSQLPSFEMQTFGTAFLGLFVCSLLFYGGQFAGAVVLGAWILHYMLRSKGISVDPKSEIKKRAAAINSLFQLNQKISSIMQQVQDETGLHFSEKVKALNHDLRGPVAALAALGQNNVTPGSDHGRLIKHIAKRIAGVIESANTFNYHDRLSFAEIRSIILQVVREKELLMHELHIEFSLMTTFPNMGAYVVIAVSVLERVTSNLVDNSIQALSDGGHIKVTLSEVDKQLQISIKDNGNGFDPDQLLNPSWKTKKPKGSGLGLRICKELLHPFSATIYIESKLGKGTEVVVRIPLTSPAP